MAFKLWLEVPFRLICCLSVCRRRHSSLGVLFFCFFLLHKIFDTQYSKVQKTLPHIFCSISRLQVLTNRFPVIKVLIESTCLF